MTGDVPYLRDSIYKRVDSQHGLHSGVDRAADDPVREHILYRAKVKLALRGSPVFGDVRQPQRVGRISGELVPDATLRVSDRAEIVVDCKSRFLAVPSSPHPERAPPGVIAADPPRCPVSHRLPDVTGLICEETVPDLWVVAVNIEQRVRPIRFDDLTIGGGIEQPPVVGLASKRENPARHRDRDPVRGELPRERVKPFPGRFSCYRYAAARRGT